MRSLSADAENVKLETLLAAGVTLSELLVVLSIIALVLGVGAAFMTESTKDLSLRASVGELKAIIRYARSTSINQHTPCYVYVDAQTGKVLTLSRKNVGLWRFEKEDKAVFQLKSGPSIMPGRLGNGVYIPAKGHVTCGDFRLLMPDQGLVVEGWFLTDSRRQQTLFAKEKEFSLSMKLDGTLSAKVFGKEIKTAVETVTKPGAAAAVAGKEMEVETSSKNVVPLFTWFHAALIFDGATLAIEVNGNEVACSALPKDTRLRLLDTDTEFTVGAATSTFSGLADDVGIFALCEEERAPLSEGVTVVAADGKGIRIAFDAQGRLDRRLHKELPTITLKRGTQEEKISLTWLGTTE
ncbi:MAG: LamG-like jellyroll fold domain-containing protein [Planctomycetota bacterium]|nr:LamG-like jellyroll fold domain-containing protein [Planctomycetota bacterium]